MKALLLSIGMIAGLALTTIAQPTVTENPLNPNGPEITFENNVIDYGAIFQKAEGKRVFKFKNTGKEPLIISRVIKPCGCTTPDWPKEPIMPGASGEISVTYDTNRIGVFEKILTVESNAKNPGMAITIKGEVKVPAVPAKVPPAGSN